MFKVKGATVYPSEVEASLRDIPGVTQAFVTDVTDADGAKQVAAVVIAPELAAVPQLLDEARARMSAFNVPTLWLVTAQRDIVPMSPTGKVDKGSLQALLGARGVKASELPIPNRSGG